MWKWFILFLLQTNIISQAVTVNENVREPRQSNGDCCPCPDTGRSGVDDQDALGTQMLPHDDCPCRTPDSESAPSMFRPVFRDAETYTRPPAAKGDPKPLLKPEVGLASAVLETLREVTDEEYRDAVFRDMARNAINSADPDSSQKGSLSNEPRKIVNIIVQPKADNTDDVIPQASNLQTTSYVYPPLSETNIFDEKRGHSLKLFREPFTLPKLTNNGILQKNLFDMDNSASNIQEHLFRPLKSNFLEDFKLKTDLLKYKLFPMARNSLHDAQPTYTIGNSGSDCDHVEQTSNYRMPSLGDHFKRSKERNSLVTSQPIAKTEIQKTSQIISSPKESEEYNFKVNEAKLRSPTLDTLSANTITSTMRTEFVSNTNTRNLKSNTFDDTSKSIKNDDCNGKFDKGSPENTDLVNTGDTQIYDAFLSPSEILETKQSESVKDSYTIQESDINKEKTLDDTSNKFDSTSNQKIIETPRTSNINEFLDKENVDVDQTNPDDIDDPFTSRENKKSLCNFNDSEIGASSNTMQSAGSPENLSDIINQERDVGSDEESNAFDGIISTTTEKFTAEKTRKLDVKNNILEKIQKLKKTNERIQEKNKSNAKDTLPLFKAKVQPLDQDNLPYLSPIADINEKKLSQNNLNAMNKEAESLPILNSKEDNINEDNKCDEIDLDNNEETSNVNNILLPPNSSSRQISKDNSYAEDLPSNNDSRISTKSAEDSCDDFSSSSFAHVVTDSDSRNTEMESQASSPVVKSIQRPSNANYGVKPKVNSKVRDFFENFKSTLSNESADKDSSNYYPSTLTEISSRENNDRNRNIDMTYIRNQGNLPKSRKSNSNLESYKAKVAVPEVLNMNPEVSTLQQSYDASSIFNTVQNPQNKPNPLKLNEMVRNANIRQRTEKTVRNEDKFNKLQINSPSQNYKNVQARTDNTLRNIQQTLDKSLRQPLLPNRNGILSDANSKNVLGNILKSNDELSEKLRAFHSDLNNKISSFSQKLSDVSGSSLQAQSKFYSPIKPIQTLKSSSLSKSQYNIMTQPKNKIYGTRPPSVSETRNSLLKGNRLNNGLSLIRRENIYKPRQTQTKFSMKQSPSESLLTITRPTKLSKESMRSQLRKDLKLKPFKDSKISIRFSSTQRPELIKAVPSSVKSKLSLKTPLQKRPELRPKPKSVDSKTLASERISSRIPSPPKSSDKLSKTSTNLDLSDDSTNLRNDNPLKFLSTGTTNNSMLSKLREAVNARAKGNKIDADNISNSNALSDITQAASNNAVSIQARPMKENVSYKCKMVCIEDKSD